MAHGMSLLIWGRMDGSKYIKKRDGYYIHVNGGENTTNRSVRNSGVEQAIISYNIGCYASQLHFTSLKSACKCYKRYTEQASEKEKKFINMAKPRKMVVLTTEERKDYIRGGTYLSPDKIKWEEMTDEEIEIALN